MTQRVRHVENGVWCVLATTCVGRVVDAPIHRHCGRFGGGRGAEGHISEGRGRSNTSFGVDISAHVSKQQSTSSSLHNRVRKHGESGVERRVFFGSRLAVTRLSREQPGSNVGRCYVVRARKQ